MDSVAAPPEPKLTPPRRRIGPAKTSLRRLWVDRGSRWVVTGGGMTIIASILGILVFILAEVLPLMRAAKVSPRPVVAAADDAPKAVLTDEHLSHAVTLSLDGKARAFAMPGATPVWEKPIVDGALASAKNVPGAFQFAAATSDGRVLLIPVRFDVAFEGDSRVVRPALDAATEFKLDPTGRAVGAYAARRNADGAATCVAQLADGRVVLHADRVAGLSEEIERSTKVLKAGSNAQIRELVVDHDQSNVYAGTQSGQLWRWRLEKDGMPSEPEVASAGPSSIAALTLLIGDRSLVVGQQDGSLSVWFDVRGADKRLHLTRIRDFPRHEASIALLSPSARDKCFFASDARGGLALYHSTSERTLWKGPSPIDKPSALVYAPKANAATVAGDGSLCVIDVDNPHPETSFTSLFGKVWYEGADEPACTWQSSSGSDDFEPKLSLTPLLFGTLKGTFYSLLLAIPLAVLGAMYASQFMHPTLKRYVKPAVEIMAALPSVVLGFLAGLWLAPRIERVFPALMLMVVVLPATVLLGGLLWRAMPRSFRGRFLAGSESLYFIAVLVLGIALCVKISRSFESTVFGGAFSTWLLNTAGLQFDQRNAVIVGLAMGFAVIPIIFAIAEDAFSNVPRNLVSGSLALGANRWQTVTRVVLPTASPGIFSAIMIGFGRAVGETMIVLMATGNTPIVDWSPFNGFRTLSANIAVEVPEAPVNGTLFRTLFLAGLLLFVLTFAINTLAEIVRQRLRRKYAEL